MVSCIKIETASLVFACSYLLITSLGSLVCIALMIYVNVVIAAKINIGVVLKSSVEIETSMEIEGFYINVYLAVTLSALVVSLAFSIMLIKGLISKKAHLVKAFFVYAVTKKMFILLSLMYLFTYSYVRFAIQYAFLILFGCFLYSLILLMIRKTYLKFSNTDHDQFCHKKLEEEKSIA